jgi:hypothetical protein
MINLMYYQLLNNESTVWNYFVNNREIKLYTVLNFTLGCREVVIILVPY